jgi:hypothetical protein
MTLNVEEELLQRHSLFSENLCSVSQMPMMTPLIMYLRYIIENWKNVTINTGRRSILGRKCIGPYLPLTKA